MLYIRYIGLVFTIDISIRTTTYASAVGISWLVNPFLLEKNKEFS